MDDIEANKGTFKYLNSEYASVSNELTAKKMFADTISANNFNIGRIVGLNLETSGSLKTLDLIVGGSAKIQNDISIMGVGINGAALTVNGGHIVANKGIISNTRNNLFQCLSITGSGTDHDVCFKIDRNVDSLIQGDVTIQDANVYLDNSRVISNEIIIANVETEDEDSSGVALTTKTNWENYTEQMVSECEESEESLSDDYDPYMQVEESMERNQTAYEHANLTVKTLLNPISYMLANQDGNVVKRFTVKSGMYRIDSNGRALFKNVVSEKGRFSELETYKLKANQFAIDKLTTTSVASNVVHTDNLLKSEGIAEFDGSIVSSADILLEEGSNVNIGKNSNIVMMDGSKLSLKNGASLELGSATNIKMNGNVELDLAKLTFYDSRTGNRYRISFRDATCCEGDGIVMEYSKVEETETESERSASITETDAKELDLKLKQLGI